MNRTFSLNNVSIAQPQPQPQQQQQQQQEQHNYDDSTSTTTTASSPTSMNHHENNAPNTFFSPLSLKSTSSSNSTANTGVLKQPQPTQSHPKRRTPRNAEEFLEAAGIDSEFFANKGYYVGSMFNLNDLKPVAKSQQKEKQEDEVIVKRPIQRSLSLMKRKNSLVETASMSMANLNLFNQQFNEKKENKKFTELSLFNEYFIDKTYKYVNNSDKKNNDVDFNNDELIKQPIIYKANTTTANGNNKKKFIFIFYCRGLLIIYLFIYIYLRKHSFYFNY